LKEQTEVNPKDTTEERSHEVKKLREEARKQRRIEKEQRRKEKEDKLKAELEKKKKKNSKRGRGRKAQKGLYLKSVHSTKSPPRCKEILQKCKA